MARPLRIEYAGAFYHVINRGHRQEPIVLDDRDRQRFLYDLERMAGQFHVLIHSYCLMTNHYHMILETPDGNLSRAVQWLNVSYATYYNRRHQCAGHLFQGRFKAILVDAGSYLEALSRYIHLNPVHAGLASRAWEYPWSSCRHFVQSGKVPAWLEVNRILAGFGRTGTIARRRYAAYLLEPEATNPCDDAVGGSLLGSKSFIQWVKDTFLSARRRDQEIPDLKRLTPRPPVEAIVRAVAERLRVSPEQILRRGRKRNRARDITIYLSRELSGLSCQELGRRFGGLSGAAITMRHKLVLRQMAKDRRLTEDISQVRGRLGNS
jgi:REP element-mobilizing transposase RayT